MIYGTKFWNDKDTFHIQDNNVFEACFRKKKAPGWLESCGPTSAVNGIASMQGIKFFDDFVKIGGQEFQPEDLLMMAFNSSDNYPDLKKIRKDVNPEATFCNEIPQFYPYIVKKLFGIDCEFMWLKDWDKLIGILKNGQAVQVCEPGHYTCAVAYDDEKNEIIYNDPWNGHYAKSGFNLRYTKDYYDKSIHNYIVVYK